MTEGGEGEWGWKWKRRSFLESNVSSAEGEASVTSLAKISLLLTLQPDFCWKFSKSLASTKFVCSAESALLFGGCPKFPFVHGTVWVGRKKVSGWLVGRFLQCLSTRMDAAAEQYPRKEEEIGLTTHGPLIDFANGSRGWV